MARDKVASSEAKNNEGQRGARRRKKRIYKGIDEKIKCIIVSDTINWHDTDKISKYNGKNR